LCLFVFWTEKKRKLKMVVESRIGRRSARMRRNIKCYLVADLKAKKKAEKEMGSCGKLREKCRCAGCLKTIRDFKVHFGRMRKRKLQVARKAEDFVHRGYLMDWIIGKGNSDISSLNKAVEVDAGTMFDYLNW
jgi:hypothetical protein